MEHERDFVYAANIVFLKLEEKLQMHVSDNESILNVRLHSLSEQ